VYNLRPRPTKRDSKYAMAQIDKQYAIQKPHAQIMMMQMNINEGIKKFGGRGNYALLKELNQLCEQQALFPRKR